MTTNGRYPLRLEHLRNDVTSSNVRDFFDWPTKDVLETIEIFNDGDTSTALVFLTRPDVAYEYMNLKEPEIDGKRVTVIPEVFEEASITLNGFWLREMEDEDPNIQFKIKKIAEKFNLKLVPKKASDGDWSTNTISLVGDPWKVEQAKTDLKRKIQPIIMNRSQNVQKGFQSDSAAIQSPGNSNSGETRNVDNMNPISTRGKSSSELSDTESFNSTDSKPSLDDEGSTKSVNTNPAKKRVRALKDSGETKPERSRFDACTSNDNVVTEQPKEAKRTRTLVVKPQDLQKSKSMDDAFDKAVAGDCRPTPSTRYQEVVRVCMDFHRYLLEHSTQLNFTDSSVTQFQVSEDQMDWIIGDNKKTDLDRNVEDLKHIISKLQVRSYCAPNDFDFDILENIIKADNRNVDVTLIFKSKERTCKVVGPKEDSKRTCTWISEISAELSERNKQKNDKGDDSGSIDKGRNAHQQSGTHWHSSDQKSPTSSDLGNKQTGFPDPKAKLTKAGDGIRISKSSKDRLEFTTRGNLRVSVYQGNMIKQTTEVIVNPANEHLAHGGGLARVILDAGGPVIDQESREIILRQGKVQTSGVVHTSAGKLPPPIKYVIHAVGPTAYEFRDNQAGLVPTMKITFRNCLEYANDKLLVSSISLPPISSGIFAVPMPDIIQGAVEAVQDFDRKNPSSVLKEVHFISNDAKTTEDMISCFLKVIT